MNKWIEIKLKEEYVLKAGHSYIVRLDGTIEESKLKRDKNGRY